MAWAFCLGLVLAVLRNRTILGYLASSPGSFEAGVFFSSTLLPAAAAAVFFALLWGVGRRICRFLRVEPQGALAALPAALGIGLFGSVIFVFGLAGRIHFGIAAALAAGFLGLPEAVAAARSFFPPRKREAAPFWAVIMAGLLSFCAFHALINALAPPVGWDALAYHLALARLYLDAGSVVVLPWLKQSHWPHLMGIVYSAPISLGWEFCAALVHAGLCALLVLSVFRLGAEHAGRAAAWVSAAVLAAQPVFLELAGEPHSDGALVLFYVLSCAALWRWSAQEGFGLLAAAGLCAGLAAAVKLQGAVLCGSLFVWLLWSPRRRRSAAAFALWAALPAGLWYLKAWMTTGSPVWPFYSWIFGGRWHPELLEKALIAANVWRFPRDIGLLANNSPQFLLIPAAGLAFLAGFRALPAFFRFLFFAALPLVPLSLRFHEAWRYLLPLMPAAALACGWWCAESFRRGGKRRLAAAGLVAFAVISVPSLSQSNELFAVLGLRSSLMPGLPAREVYRMRQLPFYAFYKKAEEVLRPGSKVLLFREVRGYHLRAAYQWGDPVISTQIIYDRLNNTKELLEALRGQGLTHVLVNEGNRAYEPSQDYYSARTLALMEGMLKEYGREILRQGPLSLHELRFVAPEHGAHPVLGGGVLGKVKEKDRSRHDSVGAALP